MAGALVLLAHCVSRLRRPMLLPWVGGSELLVAQMPCVSVPPSVRRLPLAFGFQFHLAGATVIEVLRFARQKALIFQVDKRYLPNSRSHQVQRISALRDRFRASRHRGQCSAPPALPSKTTKKSGRSRIGRTFSRGQVAEGMGLEYNVLHHLSVCFYFI